MKGILSKGMAEEPEEFLHIRKCVSLGRVERLRKEELGYWRVDSFYTHIDNSLMGSEETWVRKICIEGYLVMKIRYRVV